MPYRRFGLKEVAAYLHLSVADVEEFVHHAEIPFEKQGDRVVFLKKEIDAWASQRILGSSEARLARYHEQSSARMHDLSQHHRIVAELLRADALEPAFEARTKPSVIREMVALADKTGVVVYADELAASLREREELCSTGLPGGLALLHPRHHDPYLFSDSFLLVARARHGVPFGAPDGKPTDLFFLLCCQDDRIHLHVLARLCLMCVRTKMIEELRAAADGEEMADVLRRAEDAVIQKE